MAVIIGVRFREAGRVYYFNPGKLEVEKGGRVIVETSRGVECGEVAQEPTEIPDDQIKHPLKEVIRVATEQDIKIVEGKAEKEAEAFHVCEEKILKHGLDMKLVNVESNFEGSKIIFHFTADQRVDFRNLVRDLAGVFRTRIELRQIGVRDEAKLLGGLGICGRPFCCSQFMGDFHPVSIKMAKEQGLSLNPTKISGTCGRLMCCLKYEEVAYEDAHRYLPKQGAHIDTPEGRGVVTEVNAVSGNIKVRLEGRADAPSGPPVLFHFDREKGAQKPTPSTRLLPQLGEPLSRLDFDPSPAPEPQSSRQEQRSQQQRPRGGKQQQKRKRPQQGGGAQRPQQRPPQQNDRQPAKQTQGQGAQRPQQPRQQQGGQQQGERRGAKPAQEKNRRDRHAGQQQPVYRQQPPPAAPSADSQAAPRYSEIQGPRRAVAQKPEPPEKPAGMRRPWPKRSGRADKSASDGTSQKK